MKHLINSLLFLATAFQVKSQTQRYSLPNIYNKFVLQENVTWAAEIESVYHFDSSNKIMNQNIHDYLVVNTNSGKIRAHLPSFSELDGFSTGNYSRYDNFSKIKVGNANEIAYLLADSMKRIKLFEILYIENYSLKSRIISAAPFSNFASNGISLAPREVFYCCKNETEFNHLSSDIFIKEFKREIFLDSVYDFRVIKETFGLNLIQSIWTGASFGTVKVLNLENNKIISPKEIFKYSLADSVEVQKYNAKGEVIGHIKMEGESVFPSKFLNKIEFIEKIYYNPITETFNCIIPECYLFVAKWDEINYKKSINKSFKISFL